MLRQDPSKGATHWHDTCSWAVPSWLKLQDNEWFIWYDVGDGEWLPVTYPEWLEPDQVREII